MSAERDASGLTVLRQIDSACLRYEQAWRSGSAPRIETYLVEAGFEARNPLLKALLQLDLELRSASGQQPSLDEYRERFPDDLDVISFALGETSSRVDTRGKYQDAAMPVVVFPEIGDRLEEFEIQGVLGEGAFGKVY